MMEMRMAEKKFEANEKQENKIKGHGKYTEIVEEEFLPQVCKSNYCVVHFFHKDFERCKITEMHLRKIAHEHEEARFMSIDAERAPFFVSKLDIKILPTIILFCDGIKVDEIIGFEELGGEDEFPTMLLTRRLVRGGVLIPKNDMEAGKTKKRVQKGRGSAFD
jgi:thioredoxin-like negative regulator of GroEL